MIHADNVNQYLQAKIRDLLRASRYLPYPGTDPVNEWWLDFAELAVQSISTELASIRRMRDNKET